jgi:biofilm protein TabA
MIFDELKNIETYYPMNCNFKQAAEFFKKAADLAPGRYELEDGCYVNLMEGMTHDADGAQYEAHRAYLDVHYIISGTEYTKWADIDSLKAETEYDVNGDCQMFSGEGRIVRIDAGMFYVDYPNDAHAPNCHIDGVAKPFKKCVAKIPVK